MLKYAVFYKKKFESKIRDELFYHKDRYKYAVINFNDLVIEKSTDKVIQMVSVDPNTDEIRAFFSATLKRENSSVENIIVLLFDDINWDLSLDFYQFIYELITNMNFNRVTFTALKDNTNAIKLYKKIVDNFGGRVVGELREYIKIDNNYHNMVIYEFLRKDVLASKKSKVLEGIFDRRKKRLLEKQNDRTTERI